jgi:Tripartite tricarboxylate transporter TctB family
LLNTRFRESIGEIVGGSVLCLLGIVWAVVSSDYGVIGEGGRLAPGTLPFFCGVGLAITGGVIAIKAAIVGRGNSDDSDATAGEDLEGVGAAEAAPAAPLDTASFAHATTVRAPRSIGSLPKRYPIATVYILVVLSVLIMPLVGFAAAFALGIFGILRLVERQTVLTSALVGIITALLGYVLFEVIFSLPLPEPFFL